MVSKESFCLDQVAGSSHNRHHDPVSLKLASKSRSCTIRIFGTSRCSGTVWQGAVEDNRAGTIDVCYINKTQVQRRVCSISDDGVKEGRVSVIVTTTHSVHGTQASDWLGLVGTSVFTGLAEVDHLVDAVSTGGSCVCIVTASCAVVEAIWVAVGVCVCSIRIETIVRIQCKRSSTN